VTDVLVKPAFVANEARDSGDATKLGPIAWNAARLFSGGVDGEILIRSAASATGAAWSAAAALGLVLTADARLSDARVPLAHTHAFAEVTGLPITLAGYGILDPVVLTGDARLSDARVPLAHTHLFADLTISKADLGLGNVENVALTGNVPFLAAANVFTLAQSITRAGIAAVSTDGAVLQNTTAATAGVPVQQSPRLRLRAQAWNSTTPASNTDDWWIESVPVNGATPSGLFKIGVALNGGAATFPLTLGNAGTVTVLGSMLTNGTMQAGGADRIQWASRTAMASPLNGQLNLTNSATTLGVGLDLLTDAVLKVRTRAQTGYATVDCLGLRASGAAGVSFGPAHPASITIVNGIVTACS
jgi:hypothetical protein